jgi:outer membrane protein
VSCRLVVAIVLLAATLAGRPEGAGASEGPAIAVLNVERVLNRSKAGQGLQDQLEKIRSANQAKDRETEGALRAEDEKLQKQRAVLSDEAFAQKQKELQSRVDVLRQEFEARRNRIRSAVDKAWAQIREALLEATRDVASERDIDVVVSQTGTVLISKDLNITKDVLDRLNDRLSEVSLTIEPE